MNAMIVDGDDPHHARIQSDQWISLLIMSLIECFTHLTVL